MSNENRKKRFGKAIDIVLVILFTILIVLNISSANYLFLNISVILLIVIRLILKCKLLTFLDIIFYLLLIICLITPFIA